MGRQKSKADRRRKRMKSKSYPTKKAKYGGKQKPLAGDALVWQQDGTVISVKEAFAGYVTEEEDEVEFYISTNG